MAGGFGSRLYPLTVGCPKPMVPIVDKPVLSHILGLLRRHHITDVVITLRYLAHQIQDYFGDGHHLGMNIQYTTEDTPLGTAGGVKNAQTYLDNEPFLVISGDALTDIDLSGLIHSHRQNKSLATLALKRVDNPGEYGVVVTDHDGRIKRYIEKPKSKKITTNTVNTGIYVLEPDVLNILEPNVAYDFSYDVFPHFLNQKAPFFGHVVDGYWRDIGTLHSYIQANFDMLRGKVEDVHFNSYVGGGVWMGEEVDVAADAKLYGPIYLGHGVKIDQDVTIYGPAVIGHRTVIDGGARVEQAVIGKNCLIGENVAIHKALVPEHTILTTHLYTPTPQTANTPSNKAATIPAAIHPMPMA